MSNLKTGQCIEPKVTLVPHLSVPFSDSHGRAADPHLPAVHPSCPLSPTVMAVPQSLTFMPYIMGSILGQLPGNVLGVYFGKNIKGLGAMLRGEKTSPGQIAYNVVSVVPCRIRR